MKNLSLIIAGAAIVGFVGFAETAVADEHPVAAPDGNALGFYGCDLVFGDGQNTPRQMVLTLRDRTQSFSGNSKEIVDYFGEWDNVGDLIADKCGDPS